MQEIRLTHESNIRKTIFDKWFRSTCDTYPTRITL
jgi:hypothetical protein